MNKCTRCKKTTDELDTWTCLCGKQHVRWCVECSFGSDESSEPNPTCDEDCQDAGFVFMVDDPASYQTDI